jgi:hypothetical protein
MTVSETPPEVAGNLGNSLSIATSGSNPRSGTIQSSYRYKLRACDLMALTVGDVAQGGRVQSRARLDHFRLSDRSLEGNLLTTACLFALAVNIAGEEVLQPPATLA